MNIISTVVHVDTLMPNRVFPEDYFLSTQSISSPKAKSQSGFSPLSQGKGASKDGTALHIQFPVQHNDPCG